MKHIDHQHEAHNATENERTQSMANQAQGHQLKNSPASNRQYEDAWIRTEWLIGREGLTKLQAATIAVFGLGGVSIGTIALAE